MAKILVIDDEKSIRNSMKDILAFEGHEVSVAENGMEGLVAVKREKPEVVFCDIKMPKMEGIEVLEKIKEMAPTTSVIMISGHGTIDTAIEAIKKYGAGKGLLLAIWRILRCNPFAKGGYDPVP